MYKIPQMAKTSLKAKRAYIGETIEQKITRILHNGEPISDGATQLIYTERKDGVIGDYDPRADRWDIALDAADKIAKSHRAKREMRIGDRAFDNMTIEQKTEHIKKFPHSKYKGWEPPQNQPS